MAATEARARAADVVAQLRDKLQLAVDATTLRGVAREVGMSPQGLLNLLNGDRHPRPVTARKIQEWDLRRRAEDTDVDRRSPPDAATLAAAWEVLTWELRGACRDAAVRAAAAALREHGVTLPSDVR